LKRTGELNKKRKPRVSMFSQFAVFTPMLCATALSSAPNVQAQKCDVNGPSILVAHSYGGAVITEAGTDPSVAGLVYVAAHMPDAGENEADDGKRFPSDLSKSGAIKKTADGFTYLDPAQFHEYFAGDLSAEQAAFMAQSQVPNAADNFKAVITTPAWRETPSWMVVAGADRTINPDLGTFISDLSLV
jgi:pimeloyl-ACP methyl ester carboxylesterase